MAKPQIYAKSSKINSASIQRDPEKFYDDWANDYETDMSGETYGGPECMAAMCRKYFKTNDRLLDIAAGTGLVSRHLQTEGYTNVDGLDASQKMLDLAKEANLYKEYIYCLINPGKQTPILSGAYDGAFCLGGFAPGHLNATHLAEMFRLVKKGGLLILGININYIVPVDAGDREYPYDVTKTLDEAEAKGQIKIVEKTQGAYYGDVPGMYFVIQMC